MNWFINLFKKKVVVIDSNDLLKQQYRFVVSPSGKLLMISLEYTGYVISITEWDNEEKYYRGVNEDITVIDVKILIDNH